MDEILALMRSVKNLAETVQALQRASGPLQFDRAMRRCDAIIDDLDAGIKLREVSNHDQESS